MSTKATNQALIDAIADGEPNTAEEARTAWNGLLNELYPETFRTKWDANVKTEQLQIRFRYDFIFSKQGNRVLMNGTFTANGNITANEDVMEFIDSEYNAFSNGINILNFTFSVGEYSFRLLNGTLRALTYIPSGTVLPFNISYITNS